MIKGIFIILCCLFIFVMVFYLFAVIEFVKIDKKINELEDKKKS